MPASGPENQPAPSSAAQIRRARPGASSLPAQPTSFIGREAEIAAAVAMLRQPDVRLLVMTGPGGVGKTRLAIEVAARMLDEYRGDVWYVDFSSITADDDVLPTIAQVVGVREGDDRPLFERLVAWLRERELLLALDNVEHVAAVAPRVGELLAACAGLRVLATSRIRLRLAWEHVFLVEPLAVPRAGATAIEEVGAAAAVRLFLARARAANHLFAITPENAPAIAAICRRLDGLPLAIELAAARIGVLSPQALLAQLGPRLPLLTGGPRDAPGRLQTMHDAVAWSYDLLSAEEQALFRRLAVFAGGFGLEAAAIVAGSDEPVTAPGSALWGQAPDHAPPGQASAELVDRLQALVDQSLLRQDAGPAGETRYRMLETIREFGLERLAAAGALEAARRAHAAFCLAFAEAIDRRVWTPEHPAWMARLEADAGNLRAALGWAAEHGEVDLRLRLGAALWLFWQTRGRVGEGRRWLEGALARDGGAPWARAAALVVAGMLAWLQRDEDQAQAWLAEGLARWQAIGFPDGIARALFGLAVVAGRRGDVPRMEALAEEALALFRARDDLAGQPVCLMTLATAARVRGQPERALALLADAIAFCQAIGFVQGEVVARCQSGEIVAAQGELDRAEAFYRESLALARSTADAWGVGVVLSAVAALAAGRGDAPRAARLFGAAAGLLEAADAVLPVMDPDRAAPVRDEVRQTLGERVFDQAIAAGRALSLEQAAAEADAVLAGPANAPPVLTLREGDVLRLLVQGLTSKGIATELGISESGVNFHVARIYAKFGVNNRPAAVAHALRHGLV